LAAALETSSHATTAAPSSSSSSGPSVWEAIVVDSIAFV
jgi:hypothetical protein